MGYTANFIVNACIPSSFSLLLLFSLFFQASGFPKCCFCTFSCCLCFSSSSFSCFFISFLLLFFFSLFLFFTFFLCSAFRHSAPVRTRALPVLIALVRDVLGTGTLSRSIKGDCCVPLAVDAAAEFPTDVGVFPPPVSCWVVILKWSG